MKTRIVMGEEWIDGWPEKPGHYWFFGNRYKGTSPEFGYVFLFSESMGEYRGTLIHPSELGDIAMFIPCILPKVIQLNEEINNAQNPG